VRGIASPWSYGTAHEPGGARSCRVTVDIHIDRQYATTQAPLPVPHNEVMIKCCLSGRTSDYRVRGHVRVLPMSVCWASAARSTTKAHGCVGMGRLSAWPFRICDMGVVASRVCVRVCVECAWGSMALG